MNKSTQRYFEKDLARNESLREKVINGTWAQTDPQGMLKALAKDEAKIVTILKGLN